MQRALTPAAAKELGRALRFFRDARNLTLRDVARSAHLAAQYAHNIEWGERPGVSDDACIRFAKALSLPDEVVLNLIARARVQSALEQRGLPLDQIAFIWKGVEQRSAEQGVDLEVDIATIVADILAQPPLFVKRRRRGKKATEITA